MEKPRIFVQENKRTEVKRGRKVKNNWEKKRENKKLAQQITNFVFLQDEVTNSPTN